MMNLIDRYFELREEGVKPKTAKDLILAEVSAELDRYCLNTEEE